jgi:deoxyribodipyrimidine photolyase-related protein
MACRNLVIILGDQLNADNPALEDFDQQQDHILMVEATAEATHVWSHKARIAIFLSGMRHFAETLRQQGFPVTYLQLGQHAHETLNAAWAHEIQRIQPEKIIVCEPGEYRLEQDLQTLAKQLHIPLAVKDDQHFMCSRADFKRWAAGGKTLRMEFFYREMRKKFQVLMQAGKPVGGDWNYDAENRQSFGKSGPANIPKTPQIEPDQITKQVFADVEQYFPEHPGSLEHFIWPVTRDAALDFLQDFIQCRLADFGAHQDAMWQTQNGRNSPYLWHSLLSSSLNLKLLNPREVIEAATQAYQAHQLPLQSVEGFIRQILGWREFMHGLYWLDMPRMAEQNPFKHQRDLPAWYWTGETRMNCQRQCVGQTLQHGYAHHIQRLMVTGMFGLLAEVDPRQVEAWYLAVYIDAVEWVELPNVSMAMYNNHGRFTSKPYIASGAYIKRMSNYCAHCTYKPEVKSGPSACPVTTLYWHFIIKHYDALISNPRMALMAKHVDKLDDEGIAAIQHTARQMLDHLDDL